MGMNPRGRSRGRNHNYNNNNRRFNNYGLSRNTVFDSLGPAGRLRGTAFQLMEKYLAAAKDAMSSDRVLAENCLQHADHYMRLNAMAIASENQNQNRFQQNQPQPVIENAPVFPVAEAEPEPAAEPVEETAEETIENEQPEINIPDVEKPVDLSMIAGADLSVPVRAIEENHAQSAAPRRRGRPPMRRQENLTESAVEKADEPAAVPVVRRRGRPPMKKREEI